MNKVIFCDVKNNIKTLVSRYKNDKLIIVGHENPDVDSIISGYLLNKLLRKFKMKTEFIINDKKIDEETLYICKTFGLDPTIFKRSLPKGKNKYIVVDTSSRKVNGTVASIINHHPRSIEQDIQAELYTNIKSSSTACLIAKAYENYFSKKDLKLAVISTLVDTASFNSSKSLEEDKKWAKYVCKKNNIDYSKLYETGLCLTDLTNLRKAAFTGLKVFLQNNMKIASSYVQIKKSDTNENITLNMIEKIKNFKLKKGIDVFIFIIYDMDKINSEAYLITKDIITINYECYAERGGIILKDAMEILTKE